MFPPELSFNMVLAPNVTVLKFPLEPYCWPPPFVCTSIAASVPWLPSVIGPPASATKSSTVKPDKAWLPPTLSMNAVVPDVSTVSACAPAVVPSTVE